MKQPTNITPKPPKGGFNSHLTPTLSKGEGGTALFGIQSGTFRREGLGVALFTGCLVSLAIAVCCLSSGCGHTASKQESKRTGPDSIPAFILQKVQINKPLTFPAELIPYERAEIYAKVSGYINALKVDIGDHVQQGQVLAILDAPEVMSNYVQAKADVQAAQSKYLGSFDIYKRIFDASGVDGTIALSELEKVTDQMRADSSSYEANRAKLAMYAQLQDYLTIRAPFPGIVTQRNVDQGTLVSNTNQKPLLVVEDMGLLRLRIAVPEAYTAAVLDTSVIGFTVDAQPGVTYRASLSRKSGALNLSNRTETWEFIYRNDHNELKSGMFANAMIKLGRKEASFFVPSPAVVTNLEKRFVIRLRGGKTEWVDVRNGMAIDTKTEIFGKLSEGDTIVARGTDEIKPEKEFIPKFQAK
jgi:membrane fusion protein (multidrug efflux system)